MLDRRLEFLDVVVVGHLSFVSLSLCTLLLKFPLSIVSLTHATFASVLGKFLLTLSLLELIATTTPFFLLINIVLSRQLG